MSRQSSTLRKGLLGTALALQAAAVSSNDTGVPRSGSPEAAFVLYEEGNFAEAALSLHPYAVQGHARAQLYLATLYRTGSGVTVDEYEAAKWYRKAAESGVAEAQFHLGLMYLEGVGVTENSDLALEWMSRAAAQGFGDALDVFRYMLDHDEVLDC